VYYRQVGSHDATAVLVVLPPELGERRHMREGQALSKANRCAEQERHALEG
jgi:hypothetical protein